MYSHAFISRLKTGSIPAWILRNHASPSVFPLRLLKYEALWRKIAKKNDSFPIVIPSGPLIYRIVKDYIKENGHLTLLDLDTAECRILIIL